MLIFNSCVSTDLNNYGPISKLLCLSKILERVVHCQLIYYLETHKLLSMYQSGFRTKLSTELVSTLLIDDLCKNMDKGRLTGVIFLDLSKAFNSVSQSSLLAKYDNK